MTSRQDEATTGSPHGETHRAPWPRWVTLAARLALAAVWLYAAATKLGKPLTSARAVQAYEIFPTDVAGLIGQALPIVELALGILLLIGLFTRAAATASALLLVFFIAGIASAWARGLQIDCGCFGGDGTLGFEQQPAYLQEILRDVGFLVLAAWLVLRPKSPFAVDNRFEPAADVRPDRLEARTAAVTRGNGTTP